MVKDNLKPYIAVEDATLVEVMEKISDNTKGVIFVVSQNGELNGCITDGDIRRWILKTGSLEAKAYQLMNTEPKYLFENDRQRAQECMKEYEITAIPILNMQRVIIDVVFYSGQLQIADNSDKIVGDICVVVMAGGEGTRLYPYTKILPKPLIPIGDVPILERIMNKFYASGISNFYVTVNYKKEMIKAYFTDAKPDYSINYVEEDKPLGTAGSIKLIDDKLSNPVIITNCDTLIDVNYEQLINYHNISNNALTIVSALKSAVIPYGVLHSTEGGMITSMEEKPKMSYFINTGLYVLNPDLIEKIPDNTFFHMTDLANMLLKEGYQVGMYPITEDDFLDMGEFEEMKRMEKRINKDE